MDVLLDIGFSLRDSASLVSLQNELDSVEPLIRYRGNMVVRDANPLRLAALIRTLAALMDIVEIVAGIEHIGQDLVNGGGCPFLSASGAIAVVIQVASDIKNGLVLLVEIQNEISIKLALVKKKQNVYIAASGGVLGLREGDETNNDMNREIIEAVKLRYGKAFLGSVNLYGEQRERVASGEGSPLEEYGRQKLYNFCADFVVPNDDMELAAMIRRWNGGGESELVERIVNRVQELGGVNLIWY